MWKIVLTIGVLLAIGLPIYGKGKSSQPGDNQGDGNPTQSPPPSSSGVISCVIKQDSTTIECNYPKEKPKSYFSRLSSPENLPNLALAGIGLLGVIIAVCTLIKIERQTAATERQVEHLVATERAWMIPHISQPSFDDVMNTGEKGDSWLLPIEITFTNRGQTPATAIRGLLEISSEKPIDPLATNLVFSFPEKLTYIDEPANYAPGAVYVTGEKTYLSRGILNSLLMKENATWRTGEKCLCVRGYIEYRDAFNNTHVSRFCYAYQTIVEGGGLQYALSGDPVAKPKFRKAGPDIYNEIT